MRFRSGTDPTAASLLSQEPERERLLERLVRNVVGWVFGSVLTFPWFPLLQREARRYKRLVRDSWVKQDDDEMFLPIFENASNLAILTNRVV